MIKTPKLVSSTKRHIADCRVKRQLERFEHCPELLHEHEAATSEYFKEDHTDTVVPCKITGQTYLIMLLSDAKPLLPRSPSCLMALHMSTGTCI